MARVIGPVVAEAVKATLRRLQSPGLVAGLDIGQRRDRAAMTVVRHQVRKQGEVVEHRWQVIDTWQAPQGTRAGEAAPMVADRLVELGAAAGVDVGLVLDGTGSGDAWVDALVSVGVIPALAIVLAGPGTAVRYSVDVVEEHDVVRVSAPRHPGGRGDHPSILGALESATSLPPGEDRPAVTVAEHVVATETGGLLRRQLAGLAWRAGRPDHESGSHDDLAFSLAMVVWASGFTTPAGPRLAKMRILDTDRAYREVVARDFAGAELVDFYGRW